ncbi:hypothetical protein [Paenibacillus sp.]|uniref:hypothetical protein n=1 Tax=Paenibacillus sp. TaxID=58172 RepID=UPI002D2C5035|nr:hypothetical protein [Paenibacillus sp.]HZG85508.1 hypothetical protein [Paenibacillus sp.]
MRIFRIGWLVPLLLLAACGGGTGAEDGVASRENAAAAPRPAGVGMMQAQSTAAEAPWRDAYFVPVVEFAAKWNALADEAMMTNAKLESSRFVTNEEAGTFSYDSGRGFRIDGTADAAGDVTSFALTAPKQDPFGLFTYWALAVSVTNTDVAPNEVDALFQQLGIEADGSYARAIGREVEFYRARYAVEASDEQVVFTFAKIKEETE